MDEMIEYLMAHPLELIGLACFCLAGFAVAGWFVSELTSWFNNRRF